MDAYKLYPAPLGGYVIQGIHYPESMDIIFDPYELDTEFLPSLETMEYICKACNRAYKAGQLDSMEDEDY